MSQPVVLKEWIGSPTSGRLYPPGAVGYRVDHPGPWFDNTAVVRFDYVERRLDNWSMEGWSHYYEEIEVPTISLELV
jgi:hypothetical protein